MLTFLATNAQGQRNQPKWLPPHPARKAHHAHGPRRLTYDAYSNIVTGNLGIGVIGNYFAASIGVAYERFLDKKGLVSITIPFNVYTGGQVHLGEFGVGDTRSALNGFYTAPGIQFHPVGNKRKADFSGGLAVALGQLNREDRHQNYSGHYIITQYREPLYALLPQLNVNLHTSSHFIVGFHLSIGAIFSGTGPSLINAPPGESSREGKLFLQFGIKLGGGW